MVTGHCDLCLFMTFWRDKICKLTTPFIWNPNKVLLLWPVLGWRKTTLTIMDKLRTNKEVKHLFYPHHIYHIHRPGMWESHVSNRSFHCSGTHLSQFSNKTVNSFLQLLFFLEKLFKYSRCVRPLLTWNINVRPSVSQMTCMLADLFRHTVKLCND